MKKKLTTVSLTTVILLIFFMFPISAFASESEPNVEPDIDELSISTYSENILNSSANVERTFYQNGFLITEHPWTATSEVSLSSLPYTYEKQITWNHIGSGANGSFIMNASGFYHTNSQGGLYFIVNTVYLRAKTIDVGYIYLTCRSWCTETDNKGHYEYRIAKSSDPTTGLGGGASSVSFPP